jgi:hypothetical protein
MAARRTQAQQQPSAREHRAPQYEQQRPRSRVDDVLDEDPKVEIVSVDSPALEAITKSEVLMQLDAAHKYPRSIAHFMENTTTLCTLTKATAQSCIYSLPRMDKGVKKFITGPSIRLAEMGASSWRNLHLGARVIDTGAIDVTSQGVSWDLESNNRISVEIKRGIVSKGTRYSDDLIRVTQQAAISIALRNAIFRTIPKALIDVLYTAAASKATGVDDNTFKEDRDKMIGWFKHKHGVPPEKLYARLGIAKLELLESEHLEIMIGWANAVKAGELTIDEIFGVPGERAAGGPRKSSGQALDDMVGEHKAKKSQPPPANDDGRLTPEQVHAALSEADDDWEPADRIDIIKAWSPAEQRIAYDWAVAFCSTPENQGPPEQPEFTMIGREPGSDG